MAKMVLCMQSKLCQKDLQQQQLERERALLHLRPSCQRLVGYNAAWWLQTATHVHNLGDGKRVQNLGHTAWWPAPQGPTCGLCPLVGVFIVLWGDLWLKIFFRHSWIIINRIIIIVIIIIIILCHSQISGRHEIIEGKAGQAWNQRRGGMRDQTIHLHNNLLTWVCPCWRRKCLCRFAPRCFPLSLEVEVGAASSPPGFKDSSVS